MLHWLDAWFWYCGTDSKFTKVADAEYLSQSQSGCQSVAVGYGRPAAALYQGPAVALYGGPPAVRYGGPEVSAYGAPQVIDTVPNPRTVALGADAGGLPAERGLSYRDFRDGQPVRGAVCRCHAASNHDRRSMLTGCLRAQVAVLRSSGRHTVGRVAGSWPGWVRVEVEPGGAVKDVPEGDVFRLLADLRLA